MQAQYGTPIELNSYFTDDLNIIEKFKDEQLSGCRTTSDKPQMLIGLKEPNGTLAARPKRSRF
jgi:hypothetical protein